MKKLKELTNYTLYSLNEKINFSDDKTIPFNRTTEILKDINNNKYILAYFWPMEKTVIMGMLDKFLPHIEDAKNQISRYGYELVVRNIGGLAVVADDGVLNFSLFLPNDEIDISNAYLIMVDLIKGAFSKYTDKIEYFEIENSYCPGKYDLSIDGKKFAGIAQRRLKNSIVVSIYMSICSNQKNRSKMIKEFYNLGIKGEETRVKYPEIDIECMANLSELLNYELSVDDVKYLILQELERIGFDINER
ncbi:MAG: lipoate--protein ligase family protein [Oceanivirga sp.]|nr:lipoate--protein ligase family protein [Oceanivirga sp.]